MYGDHSAFAHAVPICRIAADSLGKGGTQNVQTKGASAAFAHPTASARRDGEGIAQEQGAFGRHQFARLQTVQDLIVAVP